MLLFLYILLIFLAAYGILFESYRRAWNDLPVFTPDDHTRAGTTVPVTVVIPARNEEDNIRSCLQSILNQDYPAEKMEIIVVDDHSTDQTAARVREEHDLRVKLISLHDQPINKGQNAYKKLAIEKAVDQASGDWIIGTDADCICPPGWLKTIMSYAQEKQAIFIAAPVKVMARKTLLGTFESLDFACMQGITGAVVHKKLHCMGNGANLAYSRKVFAEVGGFQGINKKASGDDMLLMQKFFTRYPARVFFLKSPEAIVLTRPQNSWKSFLRQRIRWASKSADYTDRSLSWHLAFVFALNFLLLAFFGACFWHPDWLPVLLSLILLKTILEFPFMLRVCRFFGQSALLPYFLFLQPLHILYIVIAGILGNLPAYEWKGRKVS